jgi:hypothetical protein
MIESWLVDIVIALIVSFISFVTGIFYHSKIADKISRQRRIFLKILPFATGKDSRIILTYGFIAPQNNSDIFLLQQGDFSAIIKAREIINNIFHVSKQDFMISTDIFSHLLNYENIFSISGPKWNPVTAKIMGDLGCPVEFVPDKRMVRVTNKTTMKKIEYESQKADDELATECYGIILSGNIERSGFTKQRVIVCAGRTTLSTYSSISYLNYLRHSKSEVRKLVKIGINGNDNWCILIRAKRSPQVDKGKNMPLHDVDITFDVVQIFHQDDFLSPYQISYSIS